MAKKTDTKLKIKNTDKWPFFKAYHDSSYLMRHDSSKNIPLREPKEKRTYRLYNDSGKEIAVYQIDGGIISDENISKCDYGIYTEDDTLYLIELKGSDLTKAINQITNTIGTLVKKAAIKVTKINARIVLSKVRTPDIRSSEETNLKQLLNKSYGKGNFIKKCSLIEEHI